MANARGGGARGQYHCSFCGKGLEHVRRLIAGPGAVYICDECVELCREIIDEEAAGPAKTKVTGQRTPPPKRTRPPLVQHQHIWKERLLRASEKVRASSPVARGAQL